MANSNCLVVGTAQSTLRFYDFRTCELSRPWRHLGSFQPITAVRAITCNEQLQWIASGLTTGDVTLFETRSGIIRCQWRAHEGQVLTMNALDDNLLLTSGADKTIAIWDVR